MNEVLCKKRLESRLAVRVQIIERSAVVARATTACQRREFSFLVYSSDHSSSSESSIPFLLFALCSLLSYVSGNHYIHTALILEAFAVPQHCFRTARNYTITPEIFLTRRTDAKEGCGPSSIFVAILLFACWTPVPLRRPEHEAKII